MKIHRLLLVLLVLLLTLPLAACGGGDADTPEDGAGTEVADEETEGDADADDESVDDEEDTEEVTEEDVDSDDESDSDSESDDSEVAGLENLDSYRQTVTFSSTTGDETSSWTMLYEYVREPFATHSLWTSTDAGGTDSEWETIQIGDTTYMRGSESEEWVSYSSSDATESQSAADLTVWMNAEDYLDDPACSRKGNDDVDGHAAVLYACDKGLFTGYGALWGATGKITDGEVQTWISKEYDVPVKSITRWEGKDEDDQDVKMSWEGEITDMNENIVIAAPEGVEVPGLPEDVTLPEEAEITMAMAGVVGFTAPMAMDDVTAFFRESMPADGWTLDNESEGMLSFSKDERTATIMFSEDGDEISGSVIVQ